MVVAFTVPVLASGCSAPPMHGVVIGEPDPAPALALTAANGTRFDLAAERGRTVLLYFGYTHCPDACPTMLSDWAKVRRALGSDTSKTRFVFVAVDPERDTPVIAAEYARTFDPGIIALAANGAEVQTIRERWGFAVMKDEAVSDPSKGYGVVHPGQAFVVFPDGKLRMMYPPGTPAADIAADLSRIR